MGTSRAFEPCLFIVNSFYSFRLFLFSLWLEYPLPGYRISGLGHMKHMNRILSQVAGVVKNTPRVPQDCEATFHNSEYCTLVKLCSSSADVTNV